jgi:hypothetical protein
MCRAVTCRTCGKASWAGCGEHVEEVLGGVPAGRRCPGHDATTRRTSRKSAGDRSATGRPVAGRILGRMLGRRG